MSAVTFLKSIFYSFDFELDRLLKNVFNVSANFYPK